MRLMATLGIHRNNRHSARKEDLNDNLTNICSGTFEEQLKRIIKIVAILSRLDLPYQSDFKYPQHTIL